MEVLLLIIALSLLIVLGSLFSYLIISRASKSRWALVAGYGVFAGVIGVPLIMRLINVFGMPQSFMVTSTSVVVFSALILAVALRRHSLSRGVVAGASVTDVMSFGGKLMVCMLLAAIIMRVGVLALEVVWRPLFPWDATMHWATKARVWFEYLELRPFVEKPEWLMTYGADAHTDVHSGYPVTIPLLQLWMTSAIGRWDESLMNLPWVLCIISLGVAFYGQSREAGANTALSLAFTYLLLSMPLLNTHVALAGYADIFLGTCYCLAIMAFHNWSVAREPFQGWLAVFFAVSCTLFKNEGVFWLLTFLPAILVVVFPPRKAFLFLLGLLLVAAVSLLFFPRDVMVAGHSLGQLNLFYRPGSLGAIFESFFLHDSWHLFGYLLVTLTVLAVLFRRAELRPHAGVAAALASAALLFLFLFAFTGYSLGAIRFTAVSRIALQLVPAFMFFCLLLSKDLLSSSVESRVSSSE